MTANQAIARGRDKRNRHRLDHLPPDTDITDLVRQRYHAGWRELTITERDNDDEVLGQITRHPDTHRRIWWALDTRS